MPLPFNHSLSENLRELRLSVSLTQRQIAQFLKVDRSTYSYYELGKSEPGIETLKQLSTFYGVSIDEMVGNRLYRKTNWRRIK